MSEELTIRVRAITDDFEKGMQEVREDLGEAKEQVGGLGDSLSRISPKLGAFAKKFGQAFEPMKRQTAEASKGMREIGESAKVGASAASSAAESIVSSLGPVAIAVASIGAAIAAMKKAWDLMKSAFRAWNPTQYAKVFGTFERAVRKFMTAFGALSAPLVEKVMQLATGLLTVFTDVVEEMVKFMSFLEGIGLTLDNIIEQIKLFATVTGMGGAGMFGLFSEAEKKGKEAAEKVGEAWTKETSVGLAAFDKLNNIGFEEGDAEERAELVEQMQEATKAGEDWWAGIQEWFGGLGDWFASLNLGKVWDDFTAWASRSLSGIGENLSAFAAWAGETLGNIWAGFTTWASQSWDAIVGFASGAWSSIVSFGSNAWDTLTNIGSVAWSTVARAATTAWQSISSFARSIWDGMSATMLEIWSAFVSAGQSAWNTINNLGQTFISNIIGPIRSFIDWVSSAVQGIVGFVNNIVSGLTSILGLNTNTNTKNSVKSSSSSKGNSAKLIMETTGRSGRISGTIDKAVAAGGPSSAQLKSVSDTLKRFGLAQGGAFQPNNPQWAILGDNTSEVEVAAPYSTIVSAVMTALGEANRQGMGQSNAPIVLDVTLNIDGQKLARMQYDYNQNEIIRRNGSGAI